MSDMNMGSTVTTLPQDMITITSSGSSYTTSTMSGSILTITTAAQELLDRREMNLIVVDHKVSEMEMMKLKEIRPDYADIIKENLSKNCAN